MRSKHMCSVLSVLCAHVIHETHSLDAVTGVAYARPLEECARAQSISQLVDTR